MSAGHQDPKLRPDRCDLQELWLKISKGKVSQPRKALLRHYLFDAHNGHIRFNLVDWQCLAHLLYQNIHQLTISYKYKLLVLLIERMEILIIPSLLRVVQNLVSKMEVSLNPLM